MSSYQMKLLVFVAGFWELELFKGSVKRVLGLFTAVGIFASVEFVEVDTAALRGPGILAAWSEWQFD